ncbi:MAG: trypsin-like peptidase domain-containing protein [Planctomycetes bacterium]|nr:trypsin-like peptidase domain-containing protein [Planctomycetota bacterium]
MRTAADLLSPLPHLLLALPVLFGAACTQARLPAQEHGKLTERTSPLQVVEPDESERNLRMTPVVRAVQKAADSVVSIYLNQEDRLRGGEVTQGQGSGVILDASGLVITNWHVIAPVALAVQPLDIQVRLRDGRALPAKLLTSTPTRDLALLQLELPAGQTVKPAEIGRSSDLMIGETVIAIGNPQGHANTVTSGVLSAIGRSIRVRAPDGVSREYTELLQTDAAINAGNSGGALLDITGKLVGINNAMAVGAENIGFAIPMDVVRQEFDRQLIRSSSFAAAPDSPWLGFEVQDADGAVLIGDVIDGSPAAAAGIKAGDLLVGIGEQPVRNSIDYLRHVFTAKVEKPFPLVLRRSGREIKIAPVPTTREVGTILDAMGASIAEVTADSEELLVRKATLAFYQGSGMRRVPMFRSALRVDQVLDGSPAAAVGLERGDVVLGWFRPTRFGDQEQPLQSRSDLADVLAAARGQSVRIVVLRGDDSLVGTLDVRGHRGR